MLYRFNTREESQALVQALVAFVMVMLIMIGIVAGMLWLKRGNTLFAKRNKVTEMIVMGFAGLGALFLAQSVVTSLF